MRAATQFNETAVHTAPAREPASRVSIQAQTVAPEADRLRFLTCGSVDDGKSTLIGRLLYDSKALFEDQVQALEANFDLARLTDGLKAEREQGITIDVAWRYFATPGRRFVIADCPGHVEYTRNMVTGASNADLAVILVDARHGVVEQTRRHAWIVATLGLQRAVVCVNKLDLLGYAEAPYRAIEADLRDLGDRLGLPAVDVIPISALEGDNVVDRSDRMPWYDGPALLEHLEQVPVALKEADAAGRLPVQMVIRPRNDGHPEDRAYAGQIAGGRLRVGQQVVVLPSGQTTRIAAIETLDGPLEVAWAGQSVVVRLEGVLDIARGDLIAPIDTPPALARDLEATICWMTRKPLSAGARYQLKHTTRDARCIIREVASVVDLSTLTSDASKDTLGLNDLGRVRLTVTTPLAVDRFADHPATGRMVLIDPATGDTVAAVLVEGFESLDV